MQQTLCLDKTSDYALSVQTHNPHYFPQLQNWVLHMLAKRISDRSAEHCHVPANSRLDSHESLHTSSNLYFSNFSGQFQCDLSRYDVCGHELQVYCSYATQLMS